MGNRKAVGGTEEQPHGWCTDDWCGDFNVLRMFKQTHGRNCKSTATERERERQRESERERERERERNGKMNARHSGT